MKEYPKCLYSDVKGTKASHEKVFHMVVDNADDEKLAIKDGFRLTPEKKKAPVKKEKAPVKNPEDSDNKVNSEESK